MAHNITAVLFNTCVFKAGIRRLHDIDVNDPTVIKLYLSISQRPGRQWPDKVFLATFIESWVFGA